MMKQKRDDLIEDILSKMTLKEKLGQCTQRMLSKSNFNELLEEVKEGKIGSFILAQTAFAGHDTAEVISIADLNILQEAAVKSSTGIPLIYGKDVIHGFKTTMPIPLAQTATWDYDIIKNCCEVMAQEASNTIHWTFAPMMDICHDPRWGRIVEGPGEDPYLGAMYAQASVSGIQGEDMSQPGKIAACAKHFIGYGNAEGGRDYNRTEISDYLLYNLYLPTFRGAIDSNVATVMSSFNDINSEPVACSRHYLREILKEKENFKGFVIADWGSIDRVQKFGVAEDNKHAAELCMNAGLDMDMVTNYYNLYGEELVAEGKLSMDIIDEAVRRILKVKIDLGLFENPYFDDTARSITVKPESRGVALNAAVSSMVLLENRNNILPLKKDKKVAVVGPMANEKRSVLGTWIVNEHADDAVSLVEGIENCIGKENVLSSTIPSLDYIYQLEHNADTVIAALGEGNYSEGECSCLTNVAIPNYQVDICKEAWLKGKHVIAVIFAGRPMIITELIPYCDAILYAWHPGVRSGDAVAKLLFGEAVPSGKLPVTFPRAQGQIPLYYNTTNACTYAHEYYGVELAQSGMPNYWDCSGAPLYPFGYGMSYTTFEYGDISVNNVSLNLAELDRGERFKVGISVANRGNYDADEIVQCYVRDIKSSLLRPVRELKGFEKVHIKKGETVNIVFELGTKELGFYNKNLEFTVEPGEFMIYVGKDSLTTNKVSVYVKK